MPLKHPESTWLALHQHLNCSQCYDFSWHFNTSTPLTVLAATPMPISKMCTYICFKSSFQFFETPQKGCEGCAWVRSTHTPVVDGCCWSPPPAGGSASMWAHSLRTSLHSATLPEWKTPSSLSTFMTFCSCTLSSRSSSAFLPLSSSSFSPSAGQSLGASSLPLSSLERLLPPAAPSWWSLQRLTASSLRTDSVSTWRRLSSLLLSWRGSASSFCLFRCRFSSMLSWKITKKPTTD